MIYNEILNYEPGELIFIEDLYSVDSNAGKVRMQLKRLADIGKLVRFGRGIYYRPCENGTAFDINAAINFLIEKRFLKDGENVCGYVIDTVGRGFISGRSHNPNFIEVASNKATLDYKEFKIGNALVAVRRPRIPVNHENYKHLAFLDMVKEIELMPFEGGAFPVGRSFQGRRLLNYMVNNQITEYLLLKCIEDYPDKVFRKLWLMEVSPVDIRKRWTDISNNEGVGAYTDVSQDNSIPDELFVDVCTKFLEYDGFEDIQVVSAKKACVNIIATAKNVKYAIRCVNSKEEVQADVIKELVDGRNANRCHVGLVLTNSVFSEEAKEVAEENLILLDDYLNQDRSKI